MLNTKLLAYFFIVFALGCSFCVRAQTPANDPTWKLDTGMSDEFNGTTINPNKWHVMDCPSGDCCNFGGGSAFQKGNAIDSSGVLALRVDGPGYAPIPCSRYTSPTGGITSDSFNYSYGYYEIYAKLPGFYNNGVPCGEKFEPAFWTAYQQFNTTCLTVHNEIDILEPGGSQYAFANMNVCGWWFQNGHCGAYKAGQGQYISPAPLFLAFHKYAVEWLPNLMIYFFDDKPFYERYNDTAMIMQPMKVFIDLQLTDTAEQFCAGMPFPQYMQVDYFRYYRLNMDCGNSALILTNSDLAAYVPSVKSDITIGNGAGLVSLSSTDSVFFRAVNTITINGTFTAPLGSELVLMPSQCY